MNDTTNRRDFLRTAGVTAGSTALGAALAGCRLPQPSCPCRQGQAGKRHLITLSFDDGFRESSLKTAEVYEKYNLSACFNVIASGHLPTFKTPDRWQEDIPKGDFVLWNELQQRGHEIMPHGYRHANKQALPLAQAQDLVLRCLDVFTAELENFEPRRAVFHMPYNRATPELERWLPTQVRAYRVGGSGINPRPYAGQVRLTCTAGGPGNTEQHLDQAIENLLARTSGWLIYNAHGLDGEGWGPMRSVYLDRLLDRLVRIESVGIIPAAGALAEVTVA